MAIIGHPIIVALAATAGDDRQACEAEFLLSLQDVRAASDIVGVARHVHVQEYYSNETLPHRRVSTTWKDYGGLELEHVC